MKRPITVRGPATWTRSLSLAVLTLSAELLLANGCREG